jgi:hypothetical protein
MISEGSSAAIPRTQWGEFLQSFSREHWRWPAQLETHDLETGETVFSPESLLERIELDLEDERNPRINVVVDLDNKVVKHILFRPSRLILHPAAENSESLRIDSIHTVTTVRLRSAK